MSKKSRTKKVEATPETTELEVSTSVTEEEVPNVEEIQEPIIVMPLEDQLLKIYEASPPGKISMTYLMEQTGASEVEIGVAWHRLFDLKKIPLAEFVKPA